MHFFWKRQILNSGKTADLLRECSMQLAASCLLLCSGSIRRKIIHIHKPWNAFHYSNPATEHLSMFGNTMMQLCSYFHSKLWISRSASPSICPKYYGLLAYNEGGGAERRVKYCCWRGWGVVKINFKTSYSCFNLLNDLMIFVHCTFIENKNII